MSERSNAICHVDELKAHLGNPDNHYLYHRRDDGSVTAWMCCDFELVDGLEIVGRGDCGDGITYNPTTNTISVERR